MPEIEGALCEAGGCCASCNRSIRGRGAVGCRSRGRGLRGGLARALGARDRALGSTIQERDAVDVGESALRWGQREDKC